MSSLTINERFELDAHPDEAWAYLTQPERLVLCLPGAELTEVIDERHYAGGVKVKLGAVAMDYQGTVEFTEIDPEQRVIRMKGKGSERRGGGTATLTMEGRVHELEGGRSEVTVAADIQLAGKIVRFGRGMIQAVTAEVFKEFTARLADELAASEAAGNRRVRDGSGDEARGVSPSGDAVEQPGSSAEAVVDRAGQFIDPAGRPSGSSPEALRLLPLLVRSLRSWLRRLLGRE